MRGHAVIAGVLATCGALALSGPARADQYDFISELDNSGVSYASITDMISIGKELCHDLRNEVSPSLVLGKLRRTGFAPTEAAIILTAAEQLVSGHQVLGCRLGTWERLYRSGVRVWTSQTSRRAAVTMRADSSNLSTPLATSIRLRLEGLYDLTNGFDAWRSGGGLWDLQRSSATASWQPRGRRGTAQPSSGRATHRLGRSSTRNCWGPCCIARRDRQRGLRAWRDGYTLRPNRIQCRGRVK